MGEGCVWTWGLCTPACDYFPTVWTAKVLLSIPIDKNKSAISSKHMNINSNNFFFLKK